MNKDTIDKINKKCELERISWEQGIFTQPNHIPTNIKEPVVYTRYETGGIEGGNCWNDDRRHYYTETPYGHLQILEIVLSEIAPTYTTSDFHEIEDFFVTACYTEKEYYGNRTDYRVDYIKVSDLENILENMGILEN